MGRGEVGQKGYLGGEGMLLGVGVSRELHYIKGDTKLVAILHKIYENIDKKWV